MDYKLHERYLQGWPLTPYACLAQTNSFTTETNLQKLLDSLIIPFSSIRAIEGGGTKELAHVYVYISYPGFEYVIRTLL